MRLRQLIIAGGLLASLGAMSVEDNLPEPSERSLARRRIRGLTGVHVSVQVDEQATRLGLTQERIATVAEMQFRKSGVRLFSRKEWDKLPEVPLFEFVVRVAPTDEEALVSYVVFVELQQLVKLQRDTEVRSFLAETWRQGTFGGANSNKVRTLVLDYVQRYSDEFITEFLAANGERASTQPANGPKPGAHMPVTGNPANKQQPRPSTPQKPRIRVIELEEHTISEIIGNGKFIRLDDGSTWQVDPGDEFLVESWGSVEVVLKTVDVNGILIYEIINTEDDEEVSVTRID